MVQSYLTVVCMFVCLFVCMFCRTPTLAVAPQGSAYLRLWFAGAISGQGTKEAYLFLNDEKGQNEECFLFILRENGMSSSMLENDGFY